MEATVPSHYGATWYAATVVDAAERPRLALDLDVDVCVIGGGLAGLTAAREIARLGWSVAVLEAKRIAWNASGRNCGFVLPGFSCGIETIVERLGLDHAKALWDLSEAGVAYIRDTIRATAMPGVEPRRGWLEVSKVDNGDELLAMIGLLGEFGADVEGWPTERVRAVLKSDAYFHAIHFRRAFHIHPLNYALGLAAAAEAAGARIFELTPAIEIDPAGVRKRVTTPSARVRAAHVVLAGNTHLDSLVPPLAATLIPVNAFVGVTEPLGERLAAAVSYGGAVSDTRYANYHYRVIGGDRLLWSGAGGPWTSDPQRVAQRFRRAIARIYPQLGRVDIAYAWSGVMGFPVHRMPQIGEVTPGLWLASGFAGQGLNTTAMAGQVIARAIVQGDDTWRLFLPYALVWAGGPVGHAVAKLSHFARSTRESLAARLARRRDRARRRDELAIAPAHVGERAPSHAADDADLSAAPQSAPPRHGVDERAGENLTAG
jgi:glycine/D-amino acid oxidase-like deaminating enzyme